MFMKASGEQVWLRTPTSLPYLAASGKMITTLDHDMLLKRFDERFEPSGMCTNGTSYFLGTPPKGPCVVFCLKPSKVCAYLLINAQRTMQENVHDHDVNVLTSFMNYLNS